MSATPIPFSTKDNAKATINLTVSPSATSITLDSGLGSLFPQPYSSTCSSLGSATTLNCTGISATIGGSAAVGKLIWNKTDGSVAVITAVSTNSLTTTRLLGGTNNVWGNGDRWCIDPFVATLGVLNTSGYGVESDGNKEEVLVIGRSTDVLTAASDGRSYNGTTAQQFDPGDYVYLRVTSPIVERLKDILSVLAQKVDSYQTTTDASILALLNGSSLYAAATGSSNAYAASYANITGPLQAGMIFAFKANFSNTGTATLTVTLGGSAQSAVTIKKQGGSSNLASGDIPSGALVLVQYDGTNFQMLSQIGNAAGNASLKYSNTSDSNDISTDTSAADWNTSFTVPGNDLTAGVTYVLEAWILINGGANVRRPNIGLNFGSTVLFTFNPWITINGNLYAHVRCQITCRSTGASGSIEASGTLTAQTAAASNPLASTDTIQQVIAPVLSTVDTTASAALKLTNYWNVNDGTKSSIIKNITINRLG
jgi:hypothetical protein